MKEVLKGTLRAVAVAAGLTILSPLPARATGIFSPSQQSCSAAVTAGASAFESAIEAEIRASIAANLQAQTDACSGPLVCIGGAKNGTPCTTNSECDPGFECQPQLAGIAGAIAQAAASLRTSIAAACTAMDLVALRAGLPGCPAGSFPPGSIGASELAECIVRGTIGKLAGFELVGTVGSALNAAVPHVAVDDPAPLGVCAVTLGRRLDLGSQSGPELTPAGAVRPLLTSGCSNGTPICATKGQVPVGNMVAPPAQTFAGSIPICLTTRYASTANGTTEEGSINLQTGEQHSSENFSITLQIGTLCPVCGASTLACDSGPNLGLACTRPGSTDIACPPLEVGLLPVIPVGLQLDTEFHALAVSVNSPASGVTNPSGAFCGACDLDPTLGCTSDQECVDRGSCSGAVGSGCCAFGFSTGAFGNPAANVISAAGTRGPFLVQMAGLGCVGTTGTGLVDAVLGLPGPVRQLEVRLNALRYDATLPSPPPTLFPASTATITPTPPAVSPTFTKTPSRTATPIHTRTATRTATPTKKAKATATRTRVASRCPSIEDCTLRCGGDPLCYCLCRNRVCKCENPNCPPTKCFP